MVEHLTGHRHRMARSPHKKNIHNLLPGERAQIGHIFKGGKEMPYLSDSV